MMTAATGTGPMDVRLTAAEVAEVARVSRAAVSNWRRRFVDFPLSVAVAPGGGDLFRFGDVESWLRRHDRWPSGVERSDSLWRTVDSMRGVLGVDQLIDIACAFVALLATEPFGPGDEEHGDESIIVRDTERAAAKAELTLDGDRPLFAPLHNMQIAAAPLLMALQGLVAQPRDASAVFEQLLDRRQRLRVYRGGEYETTTELTELLVQLAEPSGTVFDPSAGEGGLLLSIARSAQPTTARLRLFGQEVNERAWRLSRQRFLVHGVQADLRLGDSLSDDAFQSLAGDTVICDPPWGPSSPSLRSEDRHRWFAGVPGEKSADLVWVQHVINHLTSDGRGYVVLPNRTLFAKGREGQVRTELLRRGCIEAVVALPRGLVSATAMSTVLWVVKTPPADVVPSPVLLVDATGEGRDKGRLTDETAGAIARVLKAHRRKPSSFKPEEGFAAAIDVIRLLERDATLVPAHWLATTIPPSALLEGVTRSMAALTDSAGRLSGVLGQPQLELEPADSRRRATKIRDLISAGSLELIKGRPIPREAFASDGTPVLVSPWSKRDNEERRYVNLRSVKGTVRLTEPGDVVVVTVGDVPRAFADEIGGHLLPDFMQCLRIHDSSLDPVTLAALISAPANRRFVAGAIIPRMSIPEVEIPLMTDAEAKKVRDMVVSLNEQELVAARVRDAAADARDKLLDALVSGQIHLAVKSP